MKSNLTNSLCLDIYLSNLSKKDYKVVSEKLETIEHKRMPLLSWDIFTNIYHQNMFETIKQIELEQVLLFAEKFEWQNDLKKAFQENNYEALIITDAKQNIIWVNKGFTEMTGYSKKEAIKQTPRFLQGKDTSLTTKKNIKQNLKKNTPFTAVITNHKKDNSSYKCEVKIYPLQNKKTTHYIAFERQVL
jgi:PAS domain S-box-containing protein